MSHGFIPEANFVSGLFNNIPEEAYHSRVRVSHHTLRYAKENGFRRFKRRYIEKNLPDLPTPSHFGFGTAADLAVLEPEKFAKRYVGAPERWKQNTNAGKDSLANFKAQNVGKEVLWPADMGNISAILEAVEENGEARSFFRDPSGMVQPVLQWIDPASGLACKARPDKVIFDAPLALATEILIGDLKTSTEISPQAWPRVTGKYGYHQQAAMYVSAFRILFPKVKKITFKFFVVQKLSDEEAELGYPTEMIVYGIGLDSLQRAHSQNADEMQELRMRIDRNSWGGKYSNQTISFDVPDYFFPASNIDTVSADGEVLE